MKVIKHKITWIDVAKPTEKDVEFIKKQHPRFHPIILDELLHPSARAMVERDDHYLFFVYHLPIYNEVTKTCRKSEIDFLITKDMVITVHYEDLEPINNFLKKITGDEHFQKAAMHENTAKATYYLVEEILSYAQRQMSHIEESVMEITKELFRRKEAALLEKISYVKRNILDYRIINRPQSIILESLRDAGPKFWDDKVRMYFSDLSGDHLKIMQQLDNFKETIESLESTNAQLLTAKTNATIQRFNVIAFLTFPIILMIGFFTVPAIDRLLESDAAFFETDQTTAHGLADEIFDMSDFESPEYGKLRVCSVAGVRNGNGPGGWDIAVRNRHAPPAL